MAYLHDRLQTIFSTKQQVYVVDTLKISLGLYSLSGITWAYIYL